MDIQQLRQSLKLKWLSYCEENRSWLVKMQIWRSYDGVRRPSSGYILATLSILEPQLKQTLPFILDLNNNPDQIIAALGLNFNPDEELRLLKSQRSVAKNEIVSRPARTSVNTPLSGKSSAKPPQENKQLLFRITPVVEQKRQSVSVVAVATPVNYHSRTKSLSMLGETPRQSLTISTQVPNQNKELNYNGKFASIPVKAVACISPSTNARSLPSWIDEFCQGVK
ncbi:DUF5331 domain-containing protein [Anabaena sp. UHCC 0451]|uniref:DUF5331 domain-containing protein n=1 Tax=Anabaena sp. UHCC 0451 TaxID=2055235 RepID=UPI002B214162|nr:DUF5331 domain-containing protein [Anabaena sp. UHCC 0451]MEA5578986.1 DUF5331 domain-containing protein [Anabaena sp. UHCC 0451]